MLIPKDVALQKIVIEVGGKTDLKSTIDQLVKLGLIDEQNAKSFLKNSKAQQSTLDTTNKKLSVMDKALSNIGPALAGAFAVSKLVAFGREIIETTAKFQKFEAVLVNTLGSKSAAQKALTDIKAFAASTPFSVAELTESFVKLANQGFKPTQAEMRKLGDLAASTGKSFDQLTEAIIDAQTGEFERLKEFGIMAQKEGDNVKFTFKGVQTQVKFTGEEIRKYVLSLGDAAGVSGSMAAISKTLGGQISNLGDSFDSLLVALGDRFNSNISGAISNVSALVEGLKDLVEVPLSEKLEKESAQFTALVTQIISANQGSEKRKLLIDQLNTQYKDYLPNLLTEKTTNDELTEVLKKVNKQYADKIIIQKLGEKVAKAQEEVDKRQARQQELVASASLLVAQAAQRRGQEDKILGKTLIEQAQILDKLAGRHNDLTYEVEIALKNASYVTEAEVELNRVLEEKNRTLALLGIKEEKANENKEAAVKAADKEVNSIKKLEEQLQGLKKTRDEQTDVTDKKAIANLNEEIRLLDEKIKKLRGEDEATKAYNKAAKEKAEFDKNFQQLNLEFEPKNTDVIKKNLDEQHKARVKQMHRNKTEVLDPAIKAAQEAEEAHTAKVLEEENKRKAIRQQILDEGINVLSTALNGFADLQREKANIEIDNEKKANQEKYNSRVELLTKQREAGIISEAQFNAKKEALDRQQRQKEAELKRKQFQADQKAAITRVEIETAVAIAKSFATYGFTPPGLIAAGAAAAQGAIQIALIKSKPVPAFKKGVIGFQGEGSETSDSNLVRISKGESVMTAEETRKYRDELEAMRKGTYEKYRMPIINKKTLAEARHESMAENIYRSLQLHNSFDDRNIVRAIDGIKEGDKGKEKLASLIASKLGDRLSEDKIY